MRGVLAAIDLTPMGRRAAERARLIADAEGSVLRLVHVLEPVGEAFIPRGLARLLFEHQERQAAEIAAWVRGRASVPVELSLMKGSPANEVARLAADSDLVVLGSSSIDMAKMGPVGRRLARKARRSVLVVRRQPRAPYRRVVAAVDLSEFSRAAVNEAFRLAPDGEVMAVFCLPTRFDSMLQAAGLFQEEVVASRSHRIRQARDAIERFVAPWEGKAKALAVDGPPLETLDEVVRRRGADLVTVASRGQGATKMVLLGTVAEGLLESVPCDVAVARVGGQFRRP